MNAILERCEGVAEVSGTGQWRKELGENEEAWPVQIKLRCCFSTKGDHFFQQAAKFFSSPVQKKKYSERAEVQDRSTLHEEWDFPP